LAETRQIIGSVCMISVSSLLIILSMQSVFGESQDVQVTSFTDYDNFYRLTLEGSGAVPDTAIFIRAFDPSGAFAGDFQAHVGDNGDFVIEKVDINHIEGVWRFVIIDYQTEPFAEITLKLPAQIIDSTLKIEQEILEKEKVEIFPKWIKELFIWYGQDLVSDIELKNALEYLISVGILDVSATSGPSGPSGPQSLS